MRHAAHRNVASIQRLFQDTKLPTEGIEAHLPHFLVAVTEGQIVGSTFFEARTLGALISPGERLSCAGP